MENTTKEKILDAALAGFAANGYKGTNLRDLAAGMGLSKSALYKHYASKEDIWNALFDRMEAYYTSHFGSPENVPPAPGSCDELLSMTMRMLDFTMHDKKVILTRRLLLTEQFRDERARQLSTLHFLTGTKDIFTKIFSEMMDNGILKKGRAGAAGVFLYRSDHGSAPPLRPGERKRVGDHATDRSVCKAFHEDIRKKSE